MGIGMDSRAGRVVPYVGTWIEITSKTIWSSKETVVPYVGTWIEICSCLKSVLSITVVPYVGTWIEIPFPRDTYARRDTSFPTWERG